MKKIIISILMFLSVSGLKAALPPGAKWYRGSIDSAFKEAKVKNKPLFLYWGAVWCPPCNQIQKRIYKTKLFKEAVKNFIPVYLNGDDDRAQIWGERLKAKGYPTMMILSPLGKELLRLPTGITAKKYTQMMIQTAKNLKSIEELIKLSKDSSLKKNDWSSLSFYSWGQDYKIAENEDSKFELLLKLYNRIPKKYKEEKARTYLQLSALSSTEHNLKKIDKKILKKSLEVILGSDEFLSRSYELITDYSLEFFKLLKDDKKLLNSYFNTLRSFSNNEKISLLKRMSFLSARIKFINEKGFLDLKNKKREIKLSLKLIKELTMKKLDSYQKHALLSSAIWNFIQLKDLKSAKKLSMEQLKTSKAPFYFMSYLSYIEKEEKNYKKALYWRKRGYDESVGSATRFQWGTRYLETIVDLNNIDSKKLLTSYSKIFQEVILSKDAFSGRNKKRFKSLEKAFLKLNTKADKKIITALYKITKDSCKRDLRCLNWGEKKLTLWKGISKL